MHIEDELLVLRFSSRSSTVSFEKTHTQARFNFVRASLYVTTQPVYGGISILIRSTYTAFCKLYLKGRNAVTSVSVSV